MQKTRKSKSLNFGFRFVCQKQMMLFQT